MPPITHHRYLAFVAFNEQKKYANDLREAEISRFIELGFFSNSRNLKSFSIGRFFFYTIQETQVSNVILNVLK